MRKQKTIKIDDLEITVKELRIKDIKRIIGQGDDLLGGDLGQMEELLPIVTDLPLSAIDDMSPSELKIIWEVFREVNEVFLELVAKTEIVEVLKSSILKDLTALFADSLDQVTPTHGNMDTLSS